MRTPSFAVIPVALLAAQGLLSQQPAALPPPPSATVPGQPPPPTLPPTPAIPVTIGTVTPGDLSILVVDPATGIRTTGVPVSKPFEIRFDLDFPGGTPEDFVREIEAAGVGTLNVIIPRELADTEIPAVRVKSVTVPQLFEALTEASRKTVSYPVSLHPGGLPQYVGAVQLQQKQTSFGFRTQGEPSATSIWYFFAERAPATTPPPVAKVVRFHQLAPYLEPDRYTVDDITTAIQTGWRMLGEENPPALNFHKDTKLLIAHGTEAQLRMIEEVLSQLSPRVPTPSFPVPAGRLPVPPRSVAPTPQGEVQPPPAAAPVVPKP